MDWAVAAGLILLGLGWGVVRVWMGTGSLAWASRTQPRLGLTFEPGDPEETLRVLEVLANHHAVATFIAPNPQLSELLERAGHQALHTTPPEAFRWPWQVWQALPSGGVYRPWRGWFGPLTHAVAKAKNCQILLWDLSADEASNTPIATLAERLVFYGKPGSILRFGLVKGRTATVLEAALSRWQQEGYSFATLGALEPQPLLLREGLQRILQVWEESYDRKRGCFRLGYGPYDILRVERKPYTGPAIPGIPHGSLGIEIHLESARLAAVGPRQVLTAFRNALRRVARLMLEDPELKLLYGHSALAEPGRIMGFHSVPLSKNDEWIVTSASRWFQWLYRGETHRQDTKAQMAYIPRDELIARFGPKPQAQEPSS